MRACRPLNSVFLLDDPNRCLPAGREACDAAKAGRLDGAGAWDSATPCAKGDYRGDRGITSRSLTCCFTYIYDLIIADWAAYLSLASLETRRPDRSAEEPLEFERELRIGWHPGLMTEGAIGRIGRRFLISRSPGRCLDQVQDIGGGEVFLVGKLVANVPQALEDLAERVVCATEHYG